MKISFDLDDTLIPGNREDFPTESRTFLQKLLGIEFIRKNTRPVINTLKAEGHEVGIYTTSFRSKFKIWLTLFTYGILPDFIINERANQIQLRRSRVISSKYPPAFQIDLHIDDSQGVKMEGERFNFQTIIIEKDDLDWDKTITQAIPKMFQ